MFSKEESRLLKQDFWTSFGKSFPRKWILYNTKIKGLSLKFHFDTKTALVALDIEDDLEDRINHWGKILALKSILKDDFLPEAIFEEEYFLENGKEISRVYVLLDAPVSIHNKKSWRITMEFFNETMSKLEAFFVEYQDIIKT
ncbi:DUF4268 domain-containing protein [Xanthomarina sp. F1114]|uniref:DUF4268 domain-containing protein n=1 Tax=Xanthomarina sp. F1114 TaxID=2996019 RepID=UPI00225E36BE|nr:DUF4268 domain-containing protein [Xanthomarina sp. F1114]MCX7548655.1 DUF4268 domain-containing protein [Xanthomarina sp. F1114]